MMFCPEGYQLIGSWFCRDSVFICQLLPENMIICDQGQIISLTGLLARVSLKQLKIEFYWLMLPAVIGIYMFTKTINLLL